MKKTLLAFGCSLVLPLSASAATYYVSPKGNDGNSCSQAQSSNKSRKTIQAGFKCAGPGDTVFVAGGTYVESVSIGNSGKKGSPITLKAKPGEKVAWRSKDSNPNSRNGALTIAQKSFLRIEGFTFDGTVTQATIYVHNNSAKKETYQVQGIEIINNTFTNNGRNSNYSRVILFHNVGHKTFGSGDVPNVISGNKFTGNYGWSISLNVTSDTIVRKNTCTTQKSSLSNGIYIARCIQIGNDKDGNNSVRNIVEQNTIHDFVVQSYVGSKPSQIQGIKLDANADKNTIRNNRIYNLDTARKGKGGSSGIFLESRCDDNVVSGNIVYNVGAVCYRDGSRSTHVTAGNQWLNNIGYNCECGLSLSQAKGAIVKNNILSKNRSAQVYVNTDSTKNGGHVFSNNLYYTPKGSSLNTWNGSATFCDKATHSFSSWTSASKDKKSLAADPKFMNPPSDFHLRSGSPAINVGIANVDMGAYPNGTKSTTSKALLSSTPTPADSLPIPTGLRVVK